MPLRHSWLFRATFHGTHVRVAVRAGSRRARSDRPLLGELVMSPSEWAELRDALDTMEAGGVLAVETQDAAG